MGYVPTFKEMGFEDYRVRKKGLGGLRDFNKLFIDLYFHLCFHQGIMLITIRSDENDAVYGYEMRYTS